MYPFSIFLLSGFGTGLSIFGLKLATKDPSISRELLKVQMMIFITSLIVSIGDIVYMF
jgi:hypothetical protein